MLVAMLTRRNKIMDLLRQRDWSIYRLAQEVDMTYQAIHKLATADEIPLGTSHGTLLKIARVLDVSVDDLEELKGE
jgi:DNA-binding Xre family transcriptional regulator